VRIEQAYHEANVHGNVGVLGQLDKQVPHACLGCTDGLRRSGLELAVTRHVQKRHVKMHMKKKEKRNQGCACVRKTPDHDDDGHGTAALPVRLGRVLQTTRETGSENRRTLGHTLMT